MVGCCNFGPFKKKRTYEFNNPPYTESSGKEDGVYHSHKQKLVSSDAVVGVGVAGGANGVNGAARHQSQGGARMNPGFEREEDFHGGAAVVNMDAECHSLDGSDVQDVIARRGMMKHAQNASASAPTSEGFQEAHLVAAGTKRKDFRSSSSSSSSSSNSSKRSSLRSGTAAVVNVAELDYEDVRIPAPVETEVVAVVDTVEDSPREDDSPSNIVADNIDIEDSPQENVVEESSIENEENDIVVEIVTEVEQHSEERESEREQHKDEERRETSEEEEGGAVAYPDDQPEVENMRPGISESEPEVEIAEPAPSAVSVVVVTTDVTNIIATSQSFEEKRQTLTEEIKFEDGALEGEEEEISDRRKNSTTSSKSSSSSSSSSDARSYVLNDDSKKDENDEEKKVEQQEEEKEQESGASSDDGLEVPAGLEEELEGGGRPRSLSGGSYTVNEGITVYAHGDEEKHEEVEEPEEVEKPEEVEGPEEVEEVEEVESQDL